MSEKRKITRRNNLIYIRFPIWISAAISTGSTEKELKELMMLSAEASIEEYISELDL